MAKELGQELAWSAEDAAWLRTQLSKPSGQRLIRNLTAGAPAITGTTFENVALEAKEKTGWENCLKSLLANTQWREEDTTFNDFVDITK